MKYLYIRHQSQGCDYTIGCGVDIRTITAASKEEAIEKIIDLPSDWKDGIMRTGCYHDYIVESGLCDVMPAKYSNNIDAAELIEVSDEVDMMPILKAKFVETEAFKKELEQVESEASERQAYEKLKKKFDK